MWPFRRKREQCLAGVLPSALHQAVEQHIGQRYVPFCDVVVRHGLLRVLADVRGQLDATPRIEDQLVLLSRRLASAALDVPAGHSEDARTVLAVSLTLDADRNPGLIWLARLVPHPPVSSENQDLVTAALVLLRELRDSDELPTELQDQTAFVSIRDYLTAMVFSEEWVTAYMRAVKERLGSETNAMFELTARDMDLWSWPELHFTSAEAVDRSVDWTAQKLSFVGRSMLLALDSYPPPLTTAHHTVERGSDLHAILQRAFMVIYVGVSLRFSASHAIALAKRVEAWCPHFSGDLRQWVDRCTDLLRRVTQLNDEVLAGPGAPPPQQRREEAAAILSGLEKCA